MRVSALGVWTHSHAGPTTSFYVEAHDAGILLDVGINPIGRMQQLALGITGCTHVFVSHLHSDHSSGFSNFVFTRELLARAEEQTLPALGVVGAEPVLEGAQALLALQYPEREFNIDWIPVGSEDVALAEDVSLATAPTKHTIECRACRVTASGERLGFTADTAPAPHLSDFFVDCDTLIGEAFGTEQEVGSKVNARGHSTAEDLGRLVDDARIKRVVPFHFGLEYTTPAGREALLAAACGMNGAVAIDPVGDPVFDTRP